jgi:predicted ATP-grasp superfamily ATP-dependent carboligase
MRRERKPGAEVLLADASTRAGLAVMRSLGRNGVRLVVVGGSPRRMISSSRFATQYIAAPAPDDQPDAFIERVAEAVSRYDVRLVIPMTDGALVLCDRHRDAFPPRASLAAAPSSAVRNVLDKRKNLETARHLGVPCPAQFELKHREQIPEMIERLGLPVVLKHPGYRADGTRAPFDFRWLVARDRRELETFVQRSSASGELPLFQEHVTGTVHNVCCFASSGAIVALHEYRGIRRLAGASVFREIIRPTPALADYAQRLLRELRWEGVAHVGFFLRESDGDVRYMETNARFWASVEGSIRINWDFPYWAYRYFIDGDLPRPPPLAIGSRSCWHYGDLELLIKRVRRKEQEGTRASPARSLRDYLAGFGPGIHPDVFMLGDPLPAVFEYLVGLRSAIATVRGDRPKRSA